MIAFSVMALGLTVVVGWILDIAALKSVFPGFVSMKANAALCFILAGTALVLYERRLPKAARLAAGVMLMIVVVTLFEQSADLDLGIDQLLFQEPEAAELRYPGRMALATAVAFLLAGLTLQALPLVSRHARLGTIAEVFAIAVSLIGILALLGYSIHLELLYTWYAFGSVAVHTALGLAVLGAGLWVCVRRERPEEPRSEAARLTALASGLLVSVALATGIAGFGALEQEVKHTLNSALSSALESNKVEILTTLDSRDTQARIIATRPELRKHLRLLADNPARADSVETVLTEIESFLQHGFAGIAVYRPDGSELARTGWLIDRSEFAVPLNSIPDAELIWHDGVYLRHRISMRDEKALIATVATEQALPYMTDILLRHPAALGTSAELKVCGVAGRMLHCFPTRYTSVPFDVSSRLAAPDFLIERALQKESGTATTIDYRGKPVLGAYGPVGDSGLFAVLKIDAEEIYAPLRWRLLLAVLVVIALTAGGALIVRKKVRPLATRLSTAEARWRELLDSAPDAILITDRKGGINYVNTRAEALFGYSRENLLGRPVEVLIPDRHHARHVAYRAAFAEAPRLRAMGTGLMLHGRRADGSEIPVDVMLSPAGEDPDSLIMAIVRDITDRQQAEAKITQALAEKETLLKEINHRVKNNLQVIVSLLDLQADASQDETVRALFQDSQDRVRAMALIHETLYQTQNYVRIPFADYLDRLVQAVLGAQGINRAQIKITMHADPLSFNLDTAIPCGLIVNELITNCLKHAFPQGRSGQITVTLRRENSNAILLSVADDGVGWPPDFDRENTQSLGLSLVRVLARQIGAEYHFSGANGTCSELRFAID